MTHNQDTYPNRQSHHKPSGWAFQIPEFTSKEGKKIGTEFQKGLNILLDMIKVSAEKLKS